MATSGVADLGNGIGYIYKIKPSGPIVSVERNTVAGVQAMQQMAVTNAPLSAQRSAYAVIQVLASGGTGSITSILINGVNQIGAPIVVTSTSTHVVAEQIVDAINAYTAPGPGFVFTANKPYGNFPWVYVYSAPANGTAVNGLTPTISVTDPGIITTATSFINGSNDNGVYDDVFGYQFWMYASPAALPDVLPVGAMDITRFITVRGSNTGIITIDKSVGFGNVLSFLERACDTTQILLDTGGTPAIQLGFIDTADFVEGDILRIRNKVTSRVTTLVDASANVSATPNIYLTDQSPFSLTGFNSITLQYRYDANLGPIWVETGRSITNSPITITLAQFLVDAAAGNLKAGQRYFIYNLSTGVYVYAIDNISFEANGILRRYIPINYTSCWRTNMAAPVVNGTYRYYQRVYKSITGNIGSTPDTDTVNWQLMPYTNTAVYQIDYNQVILNESTQLVSWPIIEERDSNGNCVIQSKAHFVSSGQNAFNAFCWNQVPLLGQNFSGNYVCNSIFDVANSDGSVYENIVTDGVDFTGNILDGNSVVSQNNISNSSVITGNYFRNFSGNLINQGVIQNNINGSLKAPNITYNKVFSGIINDNYSTANTAFITGNTLYSAASINSNQFKTHGYLLNNTINTTSTIINCILRTDTTSQGHIANCNLSDTSITIVEPSSIVQAVIRTSNFASSNLTYNAFSNSTIIDSNFTNCIFSDCQTFDSNKSNWSNCNVTGQLFASFDTCNITGWVSPSMYFYPGTISNENIIIGISSTFETVLNTSDPTVYSAGVLTIPYSAMLCGILRINDGALTPAVSISYIVNLPDFENVQFQNASAGVTVYTFVVTPKAAVIGDDILGAANFVLNAAPTALSDYLAINRQGTLVNAITSAINYL